MSGSELTVVPATGEEARPEPVSLCRSKAVTPILGASIARGIDTP